MSGSVSPLDSASSAANVENRRMPPPKNARPNDDLPRLRDMEEIEAEMGMYAGDRLVVFGLHALSFICDLATAGLGAVGITAILVGVGTIPFYGAGTVGIVVGSLALAGAVAVFFIGCGIEVAAKSYKTLAKEKYAQEQAQKQSDAVNESQNKTNTQEV